MRYIVTDLAGAGQGDLGNAYDRKVRHAFNGRLKTAECRIRLDNPLADFLLSGRALLKAYEGQSLRFVGELQTAEEVASDDGGSVKLAFADPFYRLHQRLLGKTPAGYVDGTPLAPKDKTLLVAGMLAAANASGYTGITLGTTTNTAATGFVEFAPYKNAAEGITEIVNNLDGPDVEVVPVEPVAVAGGTQIATMDVKLAIGQAQPNAVFEYGYGRRNVASYRRAIDLTGLLNSAYGLPSQSDPAAAVATATDATSQTNYGLREGLVSTDLSVPGLRQSLVSEHVRVRKIPRTLVTFEPTVIDVSTPGRVPQFGVDFFLGDTITFRAVSQAGIVRVNAALRVYAVDWAPDSEGNVTPSFSLTAD